MNNSISSSGLPPQEGSYYQPYHPPTLRLCVYIQVRQCIGKTHWPKVTIATRLARDVGLFMLCKLTCSASIRLRAASASPLSRTVAISVFTLQQLSPRGEYSESVYYVWGINACGAPDLRPHMVSLVPRPSPPPGNGLGTRLARSLIRLTAQV